MRLDNLTPAEQQQAKDAWADKCRMRARPEKVCTGCNQAFPNTREHFGSPTGRVLRKCAACQKLVTEKHAKQAVAGPRKGDCPMCDEYGKLVVDQQAPSPIRLCRLCLGRLNQILSLEKMTHDVWFFRAKQYADWRTARTDWPEGEVARGGSNVGSS